MSYDGQVDHNHHSKSSFEMIHISLHPLHQNVEPTPFRERAENIQDVCKEIGPCYNRKKRAWDWHMALAQAAKIKQR